MAAQHAQTCGCRVGRLDGDLVKIYRNPAVREDLRRLRQYFLVWVAAGNVGQDQDLEAAYDRERGRFRCSQMSVVARNGRVAVQKRGLDHQYVGVVNVIGQIFSGLGITDNDKFLASPWQPEDILGID